MTLQSQSPRVQTWRTNSNSGGGSPFSFITRAGMGPKLAAGAGIVLVVGLLAVVWARSGNTGAAPNAEDLAKHQTPAEPLVYSPSGGAPAAGTQGGAAPTAAAPKPAPVELSMSRQPSGNAAIAANSGMQAGKAAIVDPTTNPAPTTAPGTVPPTTPTTTPPTDPTVIPTTYTAPPAPGTATGGEGTRQLIAAAQQDQAAGRLVEARTKLNKALFDPSLAASDRGAVRQQISTINDTLVFAQAVGPGDTIAEAYIIKRGDNPTNIVRNQSLPIDQRFLVRVNNLHDPKGLRIGQRIKIFRTPFHAVVHKADHRLDLYVGSPAPIGGSPGRQVGPDGQEADWVFIRSFRVGLGEANGTPEGQYVVKNGSKLENPIWKNPRTGEVFAGGAPTNPIGKHWLGLEGVDDNTRKFTGYGIHGTIDPASIGQNLSMGCVRMMPEDVALVYEVLVDKVSTVKILP